MKKYIGLTGAVLLGTVIAHEQQINPRDERVVLLKQKLAHLEQDIEIVKDELKALKGGRRRAVSSEELEVQRGGFSHAFTHHGGEILSGAAQLGQAGANIYQATHQNAPNVQGFGSIIRAGIKGAEIGHEIHDAFHHNNNLEVQDYEPEVQGFGSIIKAGIKGAEIGHEIHDAFHHNNNLEVQSEYPEVERGSLSHHIIHHGGSWANGIADAANAGVNIYNAVHNNLNVESEYPEVERGFGGAIGHLIKHHPGQVIDAGNNIYQSTQNNNVMSYPYEDFEDDEEVEEPEVQSIFKFLKPTPEGLAMDAAEHAYDHFHKKGHKIEVQSYRDQYAQRPSRRQPHHSHHTEDSDWEDDE